MKKILCLWVTLTSATLLPAQNWDVNALTTINRWDSRFIRNSSKGLAGSAYYIAAGVPSAMALYGILAKEELLTRNGIYIGTTVIEAVAVSYGLKHLINRERPYKKYPEKITGYGTESSPSFPSAHTAAAFSLATSLSISYPRWYVIAPSAAWATAVGLARINQGVHYPSDVIAGAAIGVGCGFLNVYVNRWFRKITEKK